jgi:hypothetical protein
MVPAERKNCGSHRSSRVRLPCIVPGATRGLVRYSRALEVDSDLIGLHLRTKLLKISAHTEAELLHSSVSAHFVFKVSIDWLSLLLID